MCTIYITVTQSKDLEQKYADDALVTDLIARKTALNQYEKNPDFPDKEDCFPHCIKFHMCEISTINMGSG